MTSQAPVTEEEGISEEYIAAWDSTRILTVQEGFSWSGNEKNHLFLNLGGLSFADVSSLSACDCQGDGRAVATLDWDDDGRVDFLLKNRTGPRLQLFRNRYRGDGRFLTLELRGNGTTTNRDAIGARIEVVADGRTLARTLYSSDGFLAQSSKRLHVGLGDAERVERLTVRWPDGSTSVHEDLEVDARYRVVQGTDAPERIEARPIPGADRIQSLEVERVKPERWRVPLAFELPMAEVPIPALDALAEAPVRRVGDLAGSPVLLNFWQSSCAACLAEFRVFKDRGGSFERSGLRLITVNSDAPEDLPDARDRLRWYGLDGADAGRQDERLATAVRLLYEEVFGERTNRPMVSPTSFLLDAEGRLVVVYVGPVEVDELLADVAELGRESPEPLLDRLAHGRRIVHHPRDFVRLADRFEAAGDAELAAYYRRAAEELPGFVLRKGERRPLPRDPASR